MNFRKFLKKLAIFLTNFFTFIANFHVFPAPVAKKRNIGLDSGLLKNFVSPRMSFNILISQILAFCHFFPRFLESCHFIVFSNLKGRRTSSRGLIIGCCTVSSGTEKIFIFLKTFKQRVFPAP